jgi:hypothetical protein
LEQLFPAEQQRIARLLVEKVIVSPNGIDAARSGRAFPLVRAEPLPSSLMVLLFLQVTGTDIS